jgi:hypothetical protein
MLINILKRAKQLVRSGSELFATPALLLFLKKDYSLNDFEQDGSLIDTFASLDDSDVVTSIKVWQHAADGVLGDLCRRMLNRNLYRVVLKKEPFTEQELAVRRQEVINKLMLKPGEEDFYFVTGRIVNNAYNSESDKINILFKDGNVMDIADATDTLNIKAMAVPVEKHYMCFPKEDKV